MAGNKRAPKKPPAPKQPKKQAQCAHLGCGKVPSFNMPDQVRPLYCKVHKTSADMIDVRNPRCAHEGGCIRQPSRNFPGLTRALMCLVHELPGMDDVTSRRCQFPGCKSLGPSHNAPTETRGIFCKDHAEPGMIDVSHIKCAHPGCGTGPNFNEPGQTRGLFCVDHKSETMVDVKSRLCDWHGCGTIPSFGAPGQSATRCFVHKENLINVTSPWCAFAGCGAVQPKYGVPGTKRGTHCRKHKGPTMVVLTHRGCKHSKECMRAPYYAEPDEARATMCCVHKSATMTSIKSKKCQTAKCKHDAEFGKTEFSRPQFCCAHKPEGYVDVRQEKRCQHDGCTKDHELLYETTDDQGAIEQHKRCLEHAPPGYEESLKHTCRYCDIREDVPFVCRSCKQRSHKKEHAVVRHLRRAVDVPFKYDESPGFECTRKRPDIRFELPTHDVIVEVDESQHRGYEESCECARISEIVGAIGGKAVVFIRYNPDNVRSNGSRVTVTAAERIDLLVATVKEELTRGHDTFSVRVVQLWFDSTDAGPYAARREMDITRIVAV